MLETDLLSQIFGNLLHSGTTPSENSSTRNKVPSKLDTLFFGPDVIKEVLTCYVEGMAILDIGSYIGLSDEDIHNILDKYTPFL